MSAHPSDGRPRGIQSISDRARAAAHMVLEEGKSRKEVADLYGVSRGTVQSWVEQYRDWQRDQKNLEAMRRTG